jgi:hypothetical protein
VYNPILRKVPWLRVDEGLIGTEELDADGEYLDNATEDYDIDEQLAHLGYK